MWLCVSARPSTTRHPSLFAETWAQVRRQWTLAAAIVLGGSMHAAGQAFLAGAAGVLARALAQGPTRMDHGSTAHGVHEWALVSAAAPHDQAVFALALCGVSAAVIKLVGGGLASWAETRVAGEVGAAVRLAVLDELLALQALRTPRQGDHGSAQRASTDIGERAERLTALTTHVHDVERGVAHGVLAEIRAAVQLLPLGALLIVLAPHLAGSALVALGGFGLLAFALRRAFKRAHRRASASAGILVEAADEAVRHAELWATYGATRRIRSHVAGIGRVIAREAAHLRLRASLLSSTSEVLGALALLLTLGLASRGKLGVDHGTVVPFAIAFFMAYRPLRELVDARIARARGEEALRAARGTPAKPPDEGAVSAPSRALSGWTPEPLVLDAVRTSHGRHAPLSITVPAGAIVAVVGPTGIGKTSLLRALLGLEPLASGAIHHGSIGLDARGVGPGQRPFAWVPQEAPVVGASLAVNVGLGRADDDAIVFDPLPLLADLGATELVRSLGEDVLATMRPVSGGERQWIAVARALATGLPTLLLDEPTSALDGAAQERLLAAIARLRGKRTVVLVTHRPEPLAIADIVVRLEFGPVAAVATRRSDVTPPPLP